MKKYVVKRDKNALPEKLTRYRAELNDEQFAVVTAQPKAALVVAGAGTGKTRAITYRVAYLIEHGVSPQRILLATFTNRAAKEMLRRVEALTFLSDVNHPQWAGALSMERQAELIAGATGLSGRNEDYLLDLVTHLRDMGVRDSAMERLLALVEA